MPNPRFDEGSIEGTGMAQELLDLQCEVLRQGLMVG